MKILLIVLAETVRIAIVGNDRYSIASPLFSLNSQGPGGSPNQSLRGGDVLQGGPSDEVIIGALGEERDSDGSTNGAPFFNVNPGGTAGSFDFDGIFLDTTTGLPTVSTSTSPGFCSVLDQSTNPTELATLSLDHLIRFSLRTIANDFDSGVRSDDDGLRVSVHLRSTEFVVCTKRNPIAGGGDANIQVLKLTTYPPTPASLADLPESVQQMIR